MAKERITELKDRAIEIMQYKGKNWTKVQKLWDSIMQSNM